MSSKELGRSNACNDIPKEVVTSRDSFCTGFARLLAGVNIESEERGEPFHFDF
jgi:hypothetical protein